MNLLVPLAGLLGFEVESLTERVKRTIIVNTVMALFALAGLTFLVVAGYMATAEVLGPIMASLVFAGGFLVLALAVYLGTRIGEGQRRREIAEKRRTTETSAFLTTAALTALPVLLRSPAVRTLGLPAAAIAAFLLLRDSNSED